MRLDKFIAAETHFSRREVKILIRKQKIYVDGELALRPEQKLSPDADVIVDGQPIVDTGPGYYMLNKPEGVVCANDDDLHPTVFEFFDDLPKKLHVAGRLDIDTTGLVLVTGDGKWSHQITSPRYECPKRYRVHLAEFITDDMISALETGVMLRDATALTKPARVNVVSPDEIVLTITEGRYHQVKRMLAAVGNHVDKLHRESIGGIELDSALEPGEYRPLTVVEVQSMMS